MIKRAACFLVLALAACPGQEVEPTPADASRRDAGAGRDAEVLVFEDAGRDAGPAPAINWCNIQAPASAGLKLGAQLTVFGQVFADGVTGVSGAGAGITGELGFGPAGTDPRSASGWTWAAATFNKDNGNNDEYQAAIGPSAAGSFAYAYRFKLGNGSPFYCDTDGNDGSAAGFDPAKLGALEVKENGIEWCNLQFPPSAQVTSGAKFAAFGQVFVSGATDKTGAGQGIEGELGYGPSGTDGSKASGWTWTAAAFNKDDANNDEYKAEVSPAVGTWAYAYRFRLQGGAWTYCDLDGSANGFGQAQQGSLVVAEVKPVAVEWCNIQAPHTASIKVGADVTVFGQVLATGLTNAQGQGAGIVGQLGYGPAGSDPRTASGWSWTSATFNTDVGANDEYQGHLSPAVAGNYAYAYRFRLGNAPDVYCDTDGNDGKPAGFDPAKTGTLEVKPAAVDWCTLQFPSNAAITAGGKLTAFGQVFVAGTTEAAGKGANIEGQLGYGAAASNGSTSTAWTWGDATFNKDDGNNDEYQAEVSPPVGSYGYAFRFRYKGGAWTYCDLDSSANGYDAAKQGTLEVASVKPAAVDWCQLQFPPDATISAGGKATIFGQVYVAGVTEVAGQGALVEGQVGYGPANTDATSATGWTWADASYGKDDGNNDEYKADLTPATGQWAYAYRFRFKAGAWTYCDLDSSANGYDKAKQGSLQVVAVKPPETDWCNIQFPSTASVTAGDKLFVFGQVYVAGVTEPAGAGANVEGQLGYGPENTDGSTSTAWLWSGAAFNKDDGNNDEYKADVTLGVGSYAYAYRFRLNGGTWRYCDLDGSNGAAGFDPAQQGKVTVKPVPQPTIDYCVLQWPPSGNIVAGTALNVFGQVYKAGVTEGAGKGAEIDGELGYGPAGTDGSSSTAWTWAAATFNLDASNNDEYGASLSPPAGTYSYAYRFRYKAGPWTYCDVDGSANGFDRAQQGALSVAAQPTAWVEMRPGSQEENVGASLFVAAEIYLQGVTDSPGQGTGITASVGYGPTGSQPSGANWTWTAATYAGDAKGGGTVSNDVYGAWLVAPAVGGYDVAVRFTVGAATYYADANGATAYDVAEAIHLATFDEKDPPQNDIGWCNVQWPPTLTLAPGATGDVYGQVYAQGITDNPGWGSRVRGELGVGPANSDPRTARWTWFRATFNADSGNNDEHKVVLVAPQAGTYRYVFRFRNNSGWTYCDTDGAQGKTTFDPAKSGALTVQ